jgi:hypothetical protein
MRKMAMRGEERGIGYIILDIHIRPPLQEKRGGGSVTIGTSMNKRSVAILQRELERWQSEKRRGERKGQRRREEKVEEREKKERRDQGKEWKHERKDWSGKSKGYSHIVSLIDVRVPRG